MKKRYASLFIALVLFPLLALAQLPATITVQPVLHTGATDAAHTSEPVCTGLPIADSDAVSPANLSQLGLSGGPIIGQFRVLGKWPSGNVKWLQVCTLMTTAPNGSATYVVDKSGLCSGGSCGTVPLATDNTKCDGTSSNNFIRVVPTPGSCFQIRKANFDVLDQVTVNGQVLLDGSLSQSAGFVLMGPSNPNTSCGTCTTQYQSSNDALSSVQIEQNGPVMAVLKATWDYNDGSGHVYMHGTARMFFYAGKTYTKISAEMRNADCAAVNNCTAFESAYKGFSQNELRLSPTGALSGAKSFSFGNATGGAQDGAFTGTENVYEYQAYNKVMEDINWQNFDSSAVSYINRTSGTGPYAQNGFQITHGSSNLAAGDQTVQGDSGSVEGWADLFSTSAGAGIEVGHFQMADYWPKSIQFMNGGSEIRLGIWPDQTLFTGSCGGISPCTLPYYLAWPQHNLHDIYLNFHDTALTDQQRADDFRAFQYYLAGRASIDQYNNSNVFPYKIPTPAEEDNYYVAVGTSAVPSYPNYQYCPGAVSSGHVPCMPDDKPVIIRAKAWGDPGGPNQEEFRFSQYINFLQRGMTGKYFDAAAWYRFMVEQGFQRSDKAGANPNPGPGWRVQSSNNLEARGCTSVTSANSTLTHRDNMCQDQEHDHWYGMTDWYMATGDEFMREAMLEGGKDQWMNPNTFNNQNDPPGCGIPSPGWGCHWYNERALGGAVQSMARMYNLLREIGDPDADTVCPGTKNTCGPLDLAQKFMEGTLLHDLQNFGYGDSKGWGISPTRGISYLGHETTLDCSNGSFQLNESFMSSIMSLGMHEVLFFTDQYKSTWPNRNKLADRLDGFFRWFDAEAFLNTGSVTTSGDHYRFAVNEANSFCLPGWNNIGGRITIPQAYILGAEIRGGTGWDPNFKAALNSGFYNSSIWQDGGAFAVKDIIYRDLHSASFSLLTASIPLNVTEVSPGAYHITWTPPPGVKSYRMKYCCSTAPNKQIVDLIGFDPLNGVFIGDPTTQWNWFASPDTPTVPATTDSSIDFAAAAGLPTGLTAANFALKAYASADLTPPTISITAPTGGATVTGAVLVQVNAADNTGVSIVQFFLDGSLIGSSNLAPFTLAWNTLTATNGAHTLTAKAIDGAGNSTLSAGVALTITNNATDTIPPTVSLTAPGAGTTVSNTVTVSANASDNVGVVGVQFLLDGSPLGVEDVTAPYSIAWDTTKASNALHTLSARARDAAGNTGTASPIQVLVKNNPTDTTPPTVAMTIPAAGATMSGTVVIAASASDNVGVASVQFTVDGAAFGSLLTAAPFSISFDSHVFPNGNHVFSAIAKDAAGNTAIAASVTANINNNPAPPIDKIPPTVSIASPLPGTTVLGVVTVTANAADNVAVAGVQFFADGQVLNSEVTAPPYKTQWNTSVLTNGNHVLTARARDTSANMTTSAPVTVNVQNADTTPPVVSIITPLAGASLSGTTTISASASDNVGVAGVTFLVDGAAIGPEVTVPPFSPYSITWNTNLASAGQHNITARARDAAGNTATSQPVPINVTNASKGADTTPPTVTITAPAAGVTVFGLVPISVLATDNVAVGGVTILVDGAAIGPEITTAPYTATWDSTLLPDGPHAVTAVGRDTSNNSATANVTIVSDNGTNSSGVREFGVDANTQFRVDVQDLSAMIPCANCLFQSASDLMSGQSTEVRRRPNTNPQLADAVILKQGSVTGLVSGVVGNQFVLSPTTTVLRGVALVVVTGSPTIMTNFLPNVSVTVGQTVTIRGLLFKSSGNAAPTIYAKEVLFVQ